MSPMRMTLAGLGTDSAGRDVLSYRTLKVLADLDPAVAEVTGFTRYGIVVTLLSTALAWVYVWLRYF